MPEQSYTLTRWEEDLRKMKPRFFDTYLLPAFMAWYAVQSKSMGRWPRRVLLTSAVYMAYRNWDKYKQLVVASGKFLQDAQTPQTTQVAQMAPIPTGIGPEGLVYEKGV